MRKRAIQSANQLARRMILHIKHSAFGPGEGGLAPGAEVASIETIALDKAPVHRSILDPLSISPRATERLRLFPAFDEASYLNANPDIAGPKMDAFDHAVRFGCFEEGRELVPPKHIARILGERVNLEFNPGLLPSDDTPIGRLQELGKVAPSIGVYVSSRGNAFMKGIADDVATGLRYLGVDCDVLSEESPMSDRPPVTLIVAPHDFFILGRGRDWIADDFIQNSFVLNVAQIQDRSYWRGLPFALMCKGVIDVSYQSALLFKESDISAIHFTPECDANASLLQVQDRGHPLFSVLPPAARDDGDLYAPLSNRPIDVAFFGSSNKRRDVFFGRAAEYFSNFETFIHCRSMQEVGPIRAEDGALARLASHVSRHSKVTLNIHRNELGFFEWHRIVRQGMYSNSVVVSEPCLPHPYFKPGVHYFEENQRLIPSLVEWLLRTDEGRHEADRVRGNALDAVSRFNSSHQDSSHILRFMLTHNHRKDY
jgi:hypothetical protein